MLDKFLRRLYLTCLFIALLGILYRLGLSQLEVAITVGTAGLFLASFVLMYEHEKKLNKRKNSDNLRDDNFVAGMDCGITSLNAAVIAEVDSDGRIYITHESYGEDEQLWEQAWEEIELEMRNRRK